jgi:hypothetical protein
MYIQYVCPCQEKFVTTNMWKSIPNNAIRVIFWQRNLREKNSSPLMIRTYDIFICPELNISASFSRTLCKEKNVFTLFCTKIFYRCLQVHSPGWFSVSACTIVYEPKSENRFYCECLQIKSFLLEKVFSHMLQYWPLSCTVHTVSSTEFARSLSKLFWSIQTNFPYFFFCS